MLVNTHIAVSEVMTKEVIKILPKTTMDKVKTIFQNHDFHHLPVVANDGQLLGIISSKNLTMLCHNMTIFNREKEQQFNTRFLSTVYAEEAMTKQVATLRPEDTLGIAAGVFRENLFHALPIVDENEKVVGILTTYDLIRYAY